MIINPRLFHNFICDMSYINFSVYCEISIIYRAVPNVMIAPAMPYKIASIFSQDLPDFIFIFCH